MTSPYVEKAAASKRTEAEAVKARCEHCAGKGWVLALVELIPPTMGKGECPLCGGAGKARETGE